MIMQFYNPNLQMLSYVRVGFEMNTNGLILPSNHYHTARVCRHLDRVFNMFYTWNEFFENLLWILVVFFWTIQCLKQALYFKQHPDQRISFYNLTFLVFSGLFYSLVVWDFIQVFENYYLQNQFDQLSAHVQQNRYFINFDKSVFHSNVKQILMHFLQFVMIIFILQKINYLHLLSLFLVFQKAWL